MSVRVWNIPLAAPIAWLRLLSSVLTEDEQERRDRFKFVADRRRFLICRGIARTLLGQRLDCAPRDVRLVEGEYGKPQLADGSSLHFNVSHSGDMGLVAISDTAPVGVDVELIRTTSDLDAVAEHNFSDAERAAIAALGPEAKAEAFFACWSRKEAFVKAIGHGLGYPLQNFDVDVDPGSNGGLLGLRTDDGPHDQWTLRALEVPSGYAAAVAIRAADVTIETEEWRFPGLEG